MRIAAIVDDADDAAARTLTLAALAAQERPADAVIVAEGRAGGASRNRAAGTCDAQAFLFLRAGDVPFPRALGRLALALEVNPLAAAAYAQAAIAGDPPTLGTSDFWDQERLWYGNTIAGPFLVTRTAFTLVGGFADLTLPGAEDYDFWCCCVERGLSAVFVPQILSHCAAAPPAAGEPVRAVLASRHPWLARRAAPTP